MNSSSSTEAGYSKYYDLEAYLFNHVSTTFQQTHTLPAFDFFCIIIWKANRAKSKIAKRLLKRGPNLEAAVSALMADISSAEGPKARLQVLHEWGFLLPMASAILTVLFPEEFTVYDVRVCGILKGFEDLQNKTQFEHIWAGYSGYIEAVKSIETANSSLRAKDKFLWAKSFAQQLESDIKDGFTRVKLQADVEDE